MELSIRILRWLPFIIAKSEKWFQKEFHLELQKTGTTLLKKKEFKIVKLICSLNPSPNFTGANYFSSVFLNKLPDRAQKFLLNPPLMSDCLLSYKMIILNL